MATINKNFKIKSGLVVEGSTATVGGNNVLVETASDQYIIDLIGGETLVTSVESTQMEVIAGELNIKSGVFDTSGAAAAAQSAAAADATSKANAAQTAAEATASADATSKANAAQAAAASDATSKANAAQAAAEATASADATSKANAAQAAAASDATSKANAAQAAAEATAAADATNKANGAESDAIAAAAADATTKANAADSSARGYADSLAVNYDPAGSAAAAAGSVVQDLSDHESATVAHGAAGAVVGTTNTQTLTNKTIGDTLNFSGAGAMTINSDSHIVLTPAAGSSVKWGSDVLATRAYTDQAETDAIAAAALDATAKADAAEAAANSYTDTGIANLVDSAPELLNTLNELAAAIGDDENFAANLATSVGEKVAKAGDTMTGALTLSGVPTLSLHAATKGYVDGEISTLDTAAQGYASGAQNAAELYADGVGSSSVTTANSYTDGRETAITTAYQTYANTAESDAIAAAAADATSKANAAQTAAEATAAADATSKANAAQAAAEATASADATTKANNAKSGAEATAAADATSKANAAQAAAEATASADATSKANAAQAAAASDATSKANAAQAAAIAHADALDTDDVAEGTAQYFTDVRAKSSAADLLTGATLSNITITGSGTGLTITAENGVAGSTTTDLAEGTNLYFTDARAVSALEAVTPNFTEVELNDIAKQIAATASIPTAGTNHVYSWPKSAYRSGEFLVKVSYGNHTEISKVLLTLDINDNIAVTEYGMVGTNGSLGSVSATLSGSNVQVLVTTTNNSSNISVVGTLLV